MALGSGEGVILMGDFNRPPQAPKLVEAQIVTGLLLNSESWIEITEAQINDLQGFQDKFLRKVIHLPISTHRKITKGHLTIFLAGSVTTTRKRRKNT